MSILSDLENVLAEEQRLLLSGNFTELEALVERKSRLAQKLAERKPDVPKDLYAGLVERARHNEALLGSARRGLQAAIAQLKSLSESEVQTTYSREGHRRPISRSPSTVTQKL